MLLRATAFSHQPRLFSVDEAGNSEMATERADLVIAGTKRVTASFALRASLTASPPSEIARLRYWLAIRTIVT